MRPGYRSTTGAVTGCANGSGSIATTFYDENRVAIIPIGMCYPGRDPKGGDLPPRRECAPLWHARLRAAFPASRGDLAGRLVTRSRHYLPRSRGEPLDERNDRALARFPAGIFRVAASELAHDCLAAGQSRVRERSAARVANAGWRALA